MSDTNKTLTIADRALIRLTAVSEANPMSLPERAACLTLAGLDREAAQLIDQYFAADEIWGDSQSAHAIVISQFKGMLTGRHFSFGVEKKTDQRVATADNPDGEYLIVTVLVDPKTPLDGVPPDFDRLTSRPQPVHETVRTASDLIRDMSKQT